MLLIRPTQSLTKKLRITHKPVPLPAPTAPLFARYCNDFRFARTDLAIFVNSETHLPLALKAAPYPTLVERFQTELREYLTKLGHPSLVQSSSQIEFAKTADRSVLGVITQFIKELEAEDHLGRIQPNETWAMTTRLGNTLIGGPNYKMPLERLAETIGAPVSECASAARELRRLKR